MILSKILKKLSEKIVMTEHYYFYGYQRNCYDIFIKHVMILLKLSRVLLFKIYIFNILFALYIFLSKKYKDLLLVVIHDLYI